MSKLMLAALALTTLRAAALPSQAPDPSINTLMFYAPFVTNEDIGATPNLADPSSLRYPFIDTQGIAQQSVMIQMLGEAEKAEILTREKALLEDVCACRGVLCPPSNR